jgi:hypothetical protein
MEIATARPAPCRMAPRLEFRVTSPRPTRLALRLPIFCRGRGQGGWRAGRTVDVSRTGILFEIAGGPAPEGELEFFLQSSSGRSDSGLPDLRGAGRVVRACQLPSSVWNVAVTIDAYRAVPPAPSGSFSR